MVVYDVLRRKLEIRNCETCDDAVVVNNDAGEEADTHHVLAVSGGSGSHTATEYTTYIFCSVECLKDYTDQYFQQMLEPESDPDGEPELTEREETALKSEG